MKAAVTEKAGPASVINVKDVPVPGGKEGWVLIRIRAFGLNRSELFTRQGDSPGVRFPRIQGIECVGEVENDPSRKLSKGQKVAAIMGEMGRAFDGGYAEYTLVPQQIVSPLPKGSASMPRCFTAGRPRKYMNAKIPGLT